MHRIRVVLPLLLSGCAVLPAPEEPPRVHHVVLCWLKDPGQEAQRRRIREVSTTFAAIPGVLDVRTGEPLPSDRPVVDDSFDVAITMTFADRDALAAYLVHPLHERARREVLQPLVDRILIYDFVEGPGSFTGPPSAPSAPRYGPSAPAYLEVTCPRNAALYERHGVTAQGSIRVGGAPELLPMLRSPRSRR